MCGSGLGPVVGLRRALWAADHTDWLACWIHVQKGLGSNRSCNAVGQQFRQSVHTHCSSVHQAAKLVAALLRVARVTAGLAESNGSLPPDL